MKIHIQKKGKILIIGLLAVGAFFGARWYQNKPKDVGEAQKIGNVTLPDEATASLSGNAAIKLPFPSSKLTSKANLLDIEMQDMAWQAQLSTIYANGGAQTTEGSLYESVGLNVTIKRQDDCFQSRDEFIKSVRDYKDGKRNPIMVTYMASGVDNYISVMKDKLKDLGPEYAPVVFMSPGISQGEDQVIGDIKYKLDKNNLKGAVLHGVKEDGDIDLALKLCADNNILVNQDPKLYRYDALNLSYASTFLTAVNDYNANLKQNRKIVVNGRTTGKDTLVGIDLVATWTPGDVNAYKGRGGVTIISTGIYKSIMPAATIGCKKFLNSNRDKIVQMIIATAKASDQIRSYKDVKVKACNIEADVWAIKDSANENGEYWLKYYNGVDISKDLHLGGSHVFNLQDMSKTFGLDSRDVFKDIYTTFSDIHKKLYPEDYTYVAPYAEIVDKSFIRSAIDFVKDGGDNLAGSGSATKTDYSKSTGEVVGNKNYSIEFNTGSAVIKSTDVLDDIARNVSSSDGLHIALYGHTDNVGNETSNTELSKARAVAVKDYLISKGISAERFSEVKGYGSSQPIADNNTSVGKAKNRRVQIKLVN
jgi:outer membrane protein OmpA-like peptidoglycan-associated protein